MRLVIMVTAGVLLAACAAKPSVSEFQCKAGDWKTIGFRDGAEGAPNSRLLAHQDACGEFGITPDRHLYLAGWHDGVTDFCTAANGFDLGRRGVGPSRVCTGELSQPFTDAYKDGKQLHTARNEVYRLQQRLDERHRRLDWLKQEMTDVATAQLNPELTVEQRIQLVADLHTMAEESGEIKAQIPALEAQLVDKEMELSRVEQLLAEVSYQ